jgi:hypothetical protein
LFIFGGSSQSLGLLNDVWKITPGSDWIELCSHGSLDCGDAPIGRDAMGIAMIGSTLFVFGGRIFGGQINDLWQITPGEDWIELCPSDESVSCGVPPAARFNNRMVSLGSSLFVFGGNPLTNRNNDLWEITPGGVWIELCASDSTDCGDVLPSLRSQNAMVSADLNLYVFGGISVMGAHVGDLWTISPGGNWSEVCPLLTCGSRFPAPDDSVNLARLGSSFFFLAPAPGIPPVNYDLWALGKF